MDQCVSGRGGKLRIALFWNIRTWQRARASGGVSPPGVAVGCALCPGGPWSLAVPPLPSPMPVPLCFMVLCLLIPGRCCRAARTQHGHPLSLPSHDIFDSDFHVGFCAFRWSVFAYTAAEEEDEKEYETHMDIGMQSWKHSRSIASSHGAFFHRLLQLDILAIVL